MVNINKELEFYNSTFKDLIKSNKTFHFEVPQGYFNNKKSKKFLNDLYDFYYDNDGHTETLSLSNNSLNSSILYLRMMTNKGMPKCGKKFAYKFLTKFNKQNVILFPDCYWNVVFEFAEIKDGKYKDGPYWIGV